MNYVKSKLVLLVPLLVILFFFIQYYVSEYHGNSPSQHDRVSVDNTDDMSKAGHKTIVYSYGGNDHGNVIHKAAALFEENHPGIEIKLQQMPTSTDYQRNAYQVALFSGDDSFDVFHADIIWISGLAASDCVLPLDRFFKQSERQKFFDNALQACMYNGKIFAVPSRTDVPLLYYRKDIISEPPQTYAELIDMCRKYKHIPGIKYGYIFQAQSYEGLVCNALEFIWNNGGSVMQDGKVTINSPQAVEGLQLMVDIIHSDVSSRDVLNFQEEDARIAFQDGSALFMRNWPYAYKQLNVDGSKVKDKVGIAPLPLGPKGEKSTGTLGGWNYMINKYSKNPDLAWDFVEWMSRYEAHVNDHVLGGYLPARKDVYLNAEVQKASPWLTGFEDILASARPRPVSQYYSSISELLQTNFTDAILRRINAETAINNIEKGLNEILLRNEIK